MKKKYIKDYVPKEGSSSYKYVGKYYICERTREERILSGRIQTIYGVSSLILLFLALCIPAIGTRTLYVVLPLEIMMICYVYYCIGSLNLLRIEDKMEQRVYDRVFERPIQTLTVSLILEFFALLGEIVGVLLKKPVGKEDMILTALMIVHFPFAVLLWNRQRKEMHCIKVRKEV